MQTGKQALFAVIAVGMGLFLAAVLLAAAEWGVRTFTDIPFGGNSKNLFTPNRFGPSLGNTPGVQAYAFGIPVFIDSNGFRVPSMDYRYPVNAESNLLLIGDSLTFGVGVQEPETFAGRLRGSNPGWKVYNAAVIGQTTADYRNTVRALLERGYVFSKAVLVYCLNDVSSRSAAEIERAVQASPAGDDARPSIVPAPPAAQPEASPDFVEKLKRLEIFAAANDFLREKSKLYLLIKGLVSDPSRRYFAADYQGYLDRKALWQELAPIGDVAAELASRNIEFLVIIAPYEYQLRPGAASPVQDRDIRLPQQQVSEFLAEKKISHVDAAAVFTARPGESGAHYFLGFDPMHFSPAGHAAISSLIQARVVKGSH
ncbi:MAG TPA: hypothetical protein VF859_13560 [Burkholderiales bacterium]